MTADREPNRLPLRAGAMMLLAVAVVFVGLGWHSAATSGDDPEAGLQAAQRSAPSSAPPPSPAESSRAVPDVRICVFNAGSVSGLAGEVSDELKSKGFRTAEPQNLTTSSFSENTVFYDEGRKDEAERVAQALSGDASVETRPEAFSQCRGGIPVVVVTK